MSAGPAALAEPTTAAGPEVEIVVEAEGWAEQPGAEAVIARAIAAAAQALDITGGEVAVLLTDDARMQVLNRSFRGFDKPTNVLSFPGADAAAGHLGDIAIALETTAREARADGKAFADHLAHLAVHGLLHLAGHDHEDDGEAEEMEALETAILARLGIADPYRET